MQTRILKNDVYSSKINTLRVILDVEFAYRTSVNVSGNFFCRGISEYYSSKLRGVCGGAPEGAVCECALSDDVPPGAPPRTLRPDAATVSAGARNAEEGALAALECRPTVCFCPDGSRDALLPPPLPAALRWIPDRFLVTSLVGRIWDLYFGPVGLTRF